MASQQLEGLAAAIADSLGNLRERCAEIVANSRSVRVDQSALVEFAHTIDVSEICGPPQNHAVGDSSNERAVDDAQIEVIAQCLALNAINFSYFPESGKGRWYWCNPKDDSKHGQDDEYNGVTESLTFARSNGLAQLSSGKWLESANVVLMKQIFHPGPDGGEMPMLAERAECWADLGRGLCALGGVEALLHKSGWPHEPSAVKFVGWLCAASPKWHDKRSYTKTRSVGAGAGEDEGNVEIEVAFLKRAQLCASLLNAMGVVEWVDMAALTAFSDYRLPQLFRCQSCGVLKLDPELESRIENSENIAEGCEEEVELRAATVHASELLLSLLKQRYGNSEEELTAAKLDYYLWKTAVEADKAGKLPQFHKTRTISY